MVFSNPTGLYALLALIPFILMYLIRPKNFEKVIPSLMFIMQEKNKFIKASFLQKLLRNLLLLVQMAVIILLALSVASPYVEIPHNVMVRNNVIVLDSSASMQTKDGMGTRFSNAITESKNHLGMRNTLILAENIPVILLQDASSGETLDLLNKLTPKATSTDLGDAILLAGDVLGSKKGVVNVISDFLPTEGSDLLIAKRSLTAKGNTVNFIDVHNEAENIGITDVVVDKDETIVEIKNYIGREIKVNVELIRDNSKVSEKEVTLLPNSKEKIDFKTLSGVSTIKLDVNDDMQIDNLAYISAPDKAEIKVLLITNNPEGSKIRSAMSALGVKLEIREPPTVNAYNINHDLVIVSDISKELFVPTDFVDLKKYVEKGGMLIIAAQENLAEINTLDLLPLAIVSKEDKATSVCADVIGMIFPKDPFADEPCFTSVNKYFKGTANNNSLALASAQLDGSPLVIDMKKGQGEIVYYGIIDKESGFYSDTFYPVFWSNIVNYLMKTENIQDYNFKGGRVEAISEQEVKTPSNRLKTNKLILDEAGIYEFNRKKIAVNLANEKESDVGRENIDIKSDIIKFSAEKIKDIDNLDLEVPMLAIAMLLLSFEFIYIKRRGDL